MTREKIGRSNQRNPKFKESYDEYFEWEDWQEKRTLRKKLHKMSRRPNQQQKKEH